MKSDAWKQFIEAVNRGLSHYLVPPLKGVLGPLDRVLDGAPAWVGQACAVSLFAVVALWVLTLKREYVFQGAPNQSRWCDLRLWAWLAMVPFVVVYLFFG